MPVTAARPSTLRLLLVLVAMLDTSTGEIFTNPIQLRAMFLTEARIVGKLKELLSIHNDGLRTKVERYVR